MVLQLLCYYAIRGCLISKRRRCAAARRQHDAVLQRRRDGAAASSNSDYVDDTLLNIARGCESMAREELSNNIFRQFTRDGDRTLNNLQYLCHRGNWEAIRDALAELKEKNDNNKNSFIIQAKGYKETADTSIGISFKRYNNSGIFKISLISDESIFHEKGLTFGMRIKSINNVEVAGESMSFVCALVKDIVGDIKIEAVDDNVVSHRSDVRGFYFSYLGDNISKKYWGEGSNLRNAIFCPWLDEWARAEPDNVDCRILRGICYTNWAWHARTGQYAHNVSTSQFAIFRRRLVYAAGEMHRAQQLCQGNDPLLYTNSIAIAMGLEGNGGTAHLKVETCLESLRGIADNPYIYRANVGALQYYCEKWHGSNEKMFAFARRVTSELPDGGHPLWILVPMAHCEYQLRSPRTSKIYFSRPSVVNEIGNAYHKAFPSEEAETNIQASDITSQEIELQSRNYFAYCLGMTGQYELARKQIRIIGLRNYWARSWPSFLWYLSFIHALGFDIRITTQNNNNNDNIPVATAEIIGIIEDNRDGSISSNNNSEMVETITEARVIQIV